MWGWKVSRLQGRLFVTDVFASTEVSSPFLREARFVGFAGVGKFRWGLRASRLQERFFCYSFLPCNCLFLDACSEVWVEAFGLKYFQWRTQTKIREQELL